jgi:phage major head subunit gpT-like protein
MMTNYRVIFKQALDEAFQEYTLWKEIASLMTSTTDKETYAWMGAVATMNEWKDQRQYQAMKNYTYTLTNLHYEGTVEVDRDAYEDDKYGMMPTRIQGLARRAARHYNQVVVSKLDDGITDLAYDGSAFFLTNRTIGSSGTIDNYKSGAYSGSEAEIRTAMALAFQTMMLFKDDKGVPMGLVPDTIICAPTMKIAILQALLPGVAGTVRPEAGIFSPSRVFASPWIDADTDDWYVLCTTAEVKPLIFQLRKDVEFVSLTAPDNDHVFKNKTFLYGVDDRFAAGFGDPRTAIKFHDQ